MNTQGTFCKTLSSDIIPSISLFDMNLGFSLKQLSAFLNILYA
jgi:hypothetical protein